MGKENESDLYTQWYQLWMEQSKNFLSSADENLKGIFEKSTAVNPEEHLKQIHAWLESLKQQWNFAQLSEEQKAYTNYWQQMSAMYQEASEKIVEEWIKRFKSGDPIKNTHELYELWLKCCHEIYQKSLHTKTYQEAYGEFMNAAMKFWKSSMPK